MRCNRWSRFVVAFALTSPGACLATGNQEATTTGATPATEHAPANQAQMMPVVTVVFAHGQTTLSDEAKQKLKSFVEMEKARARIKAIKVAAWSDKAVPTDPGKDLSKADRELAEKRGEEIKNYIRDNLKVHDVKVYNMAHGTSRLARAFGTEESELRSAFAKQGSNVKLSREVLVIRDNGKPSEAVVVVELQAHKK